MSDEDVLTEGPHSLAGGRGEAGAGFGRIVVEIKI